MDPAITNDDHAVAGVAARRCKSFNIGTKAATADCRLDRFGMLLTAKEEPVLFHQLPVVRWSAVGSVLFSVLLTLLCLGCVSQPVVQQSVRVPVVTLKKWRQIEDGSFEIDLVAASSSLPPYRNYVFRAEQEVTDSKIEISVWAFQTEMPIITNETIAVVTGLEKQEYVVVDTYNQQELGVLDASVSTGVFPFAPSKSD